MKLESVMHADFTEKSSVDTLTDNHDLSIVINTLEVNCFRCKLCQKIFSEATALRKHLLEEMELDNEGIGFLNLELGLDLSDDIETHIQKSTANNAKNSIVCPICSKICKSKKGLEQHKGKTHIHKRKRCVCKICDKKYENKYALRFHIIQVHEKATRVVCEICGSVIYNKYMLAAHIESVHSKTMV
ncbi:unnamed protein product [Blepharisma stoltei]|uniref:C2H2-type domain-containing protein n=1 Tax=Blepharisma stoltei TaxID=1481888 RepID=A0AAU9JF79_9CILI|nr:unnamed protein product [Blepharisma stoltei]